MTTAPFVKGSATSRAAAEQSRTWAPTAKARVLESLKCDGPATDARLQERLQMAANTERPRRIELVRDGLVRDSGKTERVGRCSAVIWECVPADPQGSLF